MYTYMYFLCPGYGLFNHLRIPSVVQSLLSLIIVTLTVTYSTIKIYKINKLHQKIKQKYSNKIFEKKRCER